MVEVNRTFFFRHPRGSGDPNFQHVQLQNVWIPAYAGMTEVMDHIDCPTL